MLECSSTNKRPKRSGATVCFSRLRLDFDINNDNTYKWGWLGARYVCTMILNLPYRIAGCTFSHLCSHCSSSDVTFISSNQHSHHLLQPVTFERTSAWWHPVAVSLCELIMWNHVCFASLWVLTRPTLNLKEQNRFLVCVVNHNSQTKTFTWYFLMWHFCKKIAKITGRTTGVLVGKKDIN